VPQVCVSGSGVSVHALVPLHALITQSVDAQVMLVPAHTPPEQTSL
jgi:hypothetical protein